MLGDLYIPECRDSCGAEGDSSISLISQSPIFKCVGAQVRYEVGGVESIERVRKLLRVWVKSAYNRSPFEGAVVSVSCSYMATVACCETIWVDRFLETINGLLLDDRFDLFMDDAVF